MSWHKHHKNPNYNDLLESSHPSHFYTKRSSVVPHYNQNPNYRLPVSFKSHTPKLPHSDSGLCFDQMEVDDGRYLKHAGVSKNSRSDLRSFFQQQCSRSIQTSDFQRNRCHQNAQRTGTNRIWSRSHTEESPGRPVFQRASCPSSQSSSPCKLQRVPRPTRDLISSTTRPQNPSSTPPLEEKIKLDEHDSNVELNASDLPSGRQEEWAFLQKLGEDVHVLRHRNPASSSRKNSQTAFSISKTCKTRSSDSGSNTNFNSDSSLNRYHLVKPIVNLLGGDESRSGGHEADYTIDTRFFSPVSKPERQTTSLSLAKPTKTKSPSNQSSTQNRPQLQELDSSLRRSNAIDRHAVDMVPVPPLLVTKEESPSHTRPERSVQRLEDCLSFLVRSSRCNTFSCHTLID